jgi:oligogalacturonide lyase
MGSRGARLPCGGDGGSAPVRMRDSLGHPTLLCQSRSSNVGAHWDIGYCPYDDGPIDVYSPQHTHPHPCFAPDGRSVIYTSDATGHAQVYEVACPAAE